MPAKLIAFIRDIYRTSDFIPLHAPTFAGNEKAYVSNTIDSTFVSSVGKYVDQFEQVIADYTDSTRAVATVNGTAALHAALYLAGVKANDLVITQPLTFVATCNAIFHIGAQPVFVDVSRVSLGMCPLALSSYLQEHAIINEKGECCHKYTGQIIRAVVPMHTFGHPVDLDELSAVCQQWHLTMIEDAAESLGSFYKGRHTGTVGRFGVLSFNGNKIITTGGGGMLLCQAEADGNHAKHITTTAKKPHPYEFYHDEPGFNYRMPNLNAALGCAQMEELNVFLENKRILAQRYSLFCADHNLAFVTEPGYGRSNYWLNAIICDDQASRDELLKQTNDNGVMTRPVWKLMHHLPMFKGSLKGDLSQAEWLAERLVNLPSTPVKADESYA